MHFLLIGASRNIGNHVLVSLLDSPEHTFSLLLRSPAIITDDDRFIKHIQAGRIQVVKGDAGDAAAIAKCWKNEQGQDRRVDTIISSLGATKIDGIGRGGFKINPPDVTSSTIVPLVAHLRTLPQDQIPRLIVVSSAGIGAVEHDKLPFGLMKWPVYSWFLKAAHVDKEGLEYVVRHAASPQIPWDDKREGVPSLLPASYLNSTELHNFIPQVILVRPAFYSDPKEEDEKKLYRASDTFETLPTFISRKAVAKFIVEECVSADSKWVGRTPSIGW